MECSVRLGKATFVGVEKGGLCRFGSIRYADCQRFCPPIPHCYEERDYDATSPSPFCAQNPNKVESFIAGRKVEVSPISEDALFLNIVSPANSSGSLPVMVWIHGGAFTSGGASSSFVDPSRLALEGQVVVVSVNYRLGFFGFVRDQHGNLANLGLLDLMESLRWVNQNISAFGGDPANVTLFGQSAGGAAIQYLLATNAAGSLFNRAIIQSSCFGALIGREKMDAHQLSIANNIPEGATMEEVLAAESRAVATNPEKGNAKYCAFAPRPGYDPLCARDRLPDAWTHAAQRVDLLIGCGQREASLYIGADPKLASLSNIPLVKRVVEGIMKSKSDAIFVDGAKDFAQAYADAGGNTYLYDFYWGVGESPWGGCHCSDVPLILEPGGEKTSALYMGKSPQEIDDAAMDLRSIWSTFAREGVVRCCEVPDCMTLRRVSPQGRAKSKWPA